MYPLDQSLRAPVEGAVSPSVRLDVWSGPALAVGASLSAETVIVTESVVAVFVPSVTDTAKTRLWSAMASGAENVG